MKEIQYLFILIALIGLCQSCIVQNGVDDEFEKPVSSQDPTPTLFVFDEEKYTQGENAIVEKIDVYFLESWPLQVSVAVHGYLPDGCTQIYQSESLLAGNEFTIRIVTIRQKDVMCTQALVPFEEYVPLDVYGLPAGTYYIDAYGKSADFTFDVDNALMTTGDE
ncbi:MAG TPA: hypothetical protein G4N92_08220 [Anaerolineae bacterium]|nr:hypothetical protein [Anaerolineae bacterium]